MKLSPAKKNMVVDVPYLRQQGGEAVWLFWSTSVRTIIASHKFPFAIVKFNLFGTTSGEPPSLTNRFSCQVPRGVPGNVGKIHVANLSILVPRIH